MKAKPLVVTLLLLALASCVTQNHKFADRHGQLPDIQALAAARQLEVEKHKNNGGLGDVSWFPLLAMNAEIYNVKSPPWPAGTGYAEFDAYGPLFMFVDAEACSYDEQQKLYERNHDAQYLWGLYRSERNDVRVPSGWRVDTETSLLFGLLRWPNEFYVKTLPYDLSTGDVPSGDVPSGEGQ